MTPKELFITVRPTWVSRIRIWICVHLLELANKIIKGIRMEIVK